MKKATLVTILISFLVVFPFVTEAREMRCETRGVWIDPFRIEKSFDDVLDDIEEANLNTIFLHAPMIENSNGINWGDAEPVNFLSRAKKAKERGLNVQVWIISRKRLHDQEETQVDYTSGTEVKAQVEWVESLLGTYGKYVDGVHFDYIRYSWNSEEINQDGMMDGVTSTIEESYKKVRDKFPDKVITAAVFTTVPAYEENYDSSVSYPKNPKWQSGVPVWYRDWFESNRGNRYDPFTDKEKQYIGVPIHMRFQQNPIEWIKDYKTGESIIDGIMPMQYTMDQDKWEMEANQWLEFLDFTKGDISKVYMGIGWLSESGHDDWGYDESGVVDKIEFLRERALKGFVIYKFGHDLEKVDDKILVEALSEGPLNTRVPSCLGYEFTLPFMDIKDSIFREYIVSLYEKKVVSGYTDGEFKPENFVSRGEMSKFMVNAFKFKINIEGEKFFDIDEDNEFFSYIQTLKNKGIVSGYSDGTFRPDEKLKRQEATKFIIEAIKISNIYNSRRLQNIDHQDVVYPDVSLDNKFATYINLASKLEIEGEMLMKGYSNGFFKPEEGITRGQMSKVVFLGSEF